MSRATTEAWYNSERFERLHLVAAYFVLNALVGLGFAIYNTIQLAGSSASASDGRGIIVSVLFSLVFALAWFQAARLLWNHRKAGAYWAIVLTLFGILNSQGFIDLLFVLIPLVLIAMSWRSLTSGPISGSRSTLP